MLGTVINTFGILIGSLLGRLLGKKLPKSMGNAVINSFGIFTIYLGVTGAMEIENTIVVILSLVFGTIIGEFIDIQGRVENFAYKIKGKMRGGQDNLATGFITGSLLFCAGAMGVVGALQGGLSGDHSMLYTKSVIDGISAFFLSASLGLGVLFSAGAVFLYQGLIVMLAWGIGPFLSQAMITEMGAIGSLLLIGLGLNILEATNIRLMNYIPAIFLPILLLLIIG